MKFIHFSDANLGSTIKDTVIKTSAEQEKFLFNTFFVSFENIIKLAIIREVDFVIFTGEVVSLDTNFELVHSFIATQFKLLEDNNIQVITDNELLKNFAENVKFLAPNQNSLIEFQGTKVFLTTDTNSQIISQANADFKIALSEKVVPNTGMFEYIAMGGASETKVVAQNPYIIFPGVIQSSAPSDTAEHGVVFAEFASSELKVDFVHTNSVSFETRILKINTENTFDQVASEIIEQIKEEDFKIFTLNIVDSNGTISEDFQRKVIFGNTVELLNKLIEGKSYIRQINFQEQGMNFDGVEPELSNKDWVETQSKIFTANNLKHVVKTRFENEKDIDTSQLTNQVALMQIKRNAGLLLEEKELNDEN